MTDLITRLEQAEAGSRELDAEISAYAPPVACACSGHCNPTQPHYAGCCIAVPNYTTSLDAITALIGEKLPGWSWGVGSDGQAAVSSPPEGRYVAFGVFAKTAPLALCAALLRAIKEGEHG